MPRREPFFGLAPSASVTLVAAVVTRLPAASCTSTATAGAIAVPAAVLAGCTRKLSFAGGPAVTVMAFVPSCPSTLAVIVATPSAWPVTSPAPVTVATVGLVLNHVTVRPLSAVPLASRGTAVSWSVPVTGTVDAGAVTSTDDTAAGGPVPSEEQAASSAATVMKRRSGPPPSSGQRLRRSSVNARPFFMIGRCSRADLGVQHRPPTLKSSALAWRRGHPSRWPPYPRSPA